MSVLREDRDCLRVTGNSLLERVPHFLNIDLRLFFARVKRERHLASKKVSANQFVATSLQTKHECTVRVQASHQTVLHVHRVVALDVLVGAVLDLIRGAVRVTAHRLLHRTVNLLVHEKGLAHKVREPDREHGLSRANLRIEPGHECLHTATRHNGRIDVAATSLRIPGTLPQLHVQHGLLRKRRLRNLNRDTAYLLAVRGTDHRIRAQSKFLRIGWHHDRCLHRLLCRFQAQQRETCLRHLHREHIIELAVRLIVHTGTLNPLT